jgi:hypothetical protein
MSDLVPSGCGYIAVPKTGKVFGLEKVSKMIENGILYLRPAVTPMGHRLPVPLGNLLVARRKRDPVL